MLGETERRRGRREEGREERQTYDGWGFPAELEDAGFEILRGFGGEDPTNAIATCKLHVRLESVQVLSCCEVGAHPDFADGWMRYDLGHTRS